MWQSNLHTFIKHARLVVLLLLSSAIIGEEKAIPDFNDYLVKTQYTDKAVPVILASENEQMFRTRLRNASKEKLNFAGEYVLTTWGCGATCSLGAAVSLKSGKVIFFPGTACCNQSEHKTVDFQANSRLFILTGYINEQGKYGRHYYELKEDRFAYITSLILNEFPND